MSTQTEAILNRICTSAAEQKVSEVYLLSGQAPFVRINGKVQNLPGENILPASFVQDVANILLTPEQQKELEQKRQILIAKEIGKLGPAQVNIYYQKNLLAIYLELLSQELIDLENLNLPKMVTEFTNLPQGIIFVVGPRDSGRATLMTAMVNYINKTQVKFIATIEKPIKYNLISVKSMVEQREVGRDVLNFVDGLSYIRTRNADVVMVSEVPNAAVMNEIFTIAETGSLVFVALETDSSIKALRRVFHFFPVSEEADVRFSLSDNLGGVICTRLVPMLGGGRVRALEILSATPAVRSVIAKGNYSQLISVLRASETGKAVSLDHYLADLVTSRKITEEEASKHCLDREFFRSLLYK